MEGDIPSMGMGGEGVNPNEGINPEIGDDMGGEDINPNEGNEMPTEFGGNFDAGVEADEDTDPKKYIQQLTGKLSQSLNSFNNENGEPDTELGKYVLGMLIKQGTKGMDEKDKKEIIKKINSNNSEDEELPEDDVDNEEEITGENDSVNDETTEMTEMPMESKIFKFTKKQIFESFGMAMSDENTTIKKVNDTNITPDTNRNRRTRPFEAPRKFKK